jgi:hypothetical protein
METMKPIRDSSVSDAAAYGVEDQMSVLAREKVSFHHRGVQAGYGSHSASYIMGNKHFYTEGNAALNVKPTTRLQLVPALTIFGTLLPARFGPWLHWSQNRHSTVNQLCLGRHQTDKEVKINYLFVHDNGYIEPDPTSGLSPNNSRLPGPTKDVCFESTVWPDTSCG